MVGRRSRRSRRRGIIKKHRKLYRFGNAGMQGASIFSRVWGSTNLGNLPRGIGGSRRNQRRSRTRLRRSHTRRVHRHIR